LLYKQYGYTKLKPPISGYSYSTEVLRRHKRNMLLDAIALLLVAGIGLLLLGAALIAITPVVPK